MLNLWIFLCGHFQTGILFYVEESKKEAFHHHALCSFPQMIHGVKGDL